MIQLTNCPPPLRITCSILLVEAKHMDVTKAKPNTEGYIRRILRLYQASKRPILPKKSVKPLQKKNKASPMAPPVESAP